MEDENVCEHGDHPAPAGKRFCSEACERCEHESKGENGCDALCYLNEEELDELRRWASARLVLESPIERLVRRLLVEHTDLKQRTIEALHAEGWKQLGIQNELDQAKEELASIKKSIRSLVDAGRAEANAGLNYGGINAQAHSGIVARLSQIEWLALDEQTRQVLALGREIKEADRG